MKIPAAIFAVLVASTLVGGFVISAPSTPSAAPPHIHAQSRFIATGKYGIPSAPAAGDVLITDNGRWSGSPVSFAYQWKDCNSNGNGCVNAAGSPSNVVRYVIVSGDAGFTIESWVTATYSGGQTATQTSAPTGVVQSTSAFPLTVSANGRYLKQANGTPWLMVGDSPQSTIGELTTASAASFFADRASLGFNTVWINLLCDGYTFCESDGASVNEAGVKDTIAPFTTGSDVGNDAGGYDLSTPNATYFSRAETIIHEAATAGLEVILDPIEWGGWNGILGKNGDGTVSTTDKDYKYGQWLGTTFNASSFPNIIWMSGNDFESYTTAANDANVISVANGIKNTDPSALQTLELWGIGPPNTSLDDTTHAGWSSLVGLNADYTYQATYDTVLRGYNQASVPTFLVEANYEGENINGASGDGCITIRICRLQEYWTMTSGAAGQLYGAQWTDRIAMGWSKSTIDSPAAVQLGYQTTLLKSREWYNLVPDQQNHPVGSLVTAGYGTYITGMPFGGSNYVTAAVTPDGTFGLAYLPDPSGTLSTITVDMTKLSGSVTARWFDPTSGTFTAISGSPFANTGTHNFTPPGANSAGDSDWVLVLGA